MQPRTLIASHRGGAFLWPENSLLAFREALRWPAEQIELDVHASLDGEPVVMHDATLDRMSEGRGPVAALPWAEIARLRVRGAGEETVPHFDQAAAVIAGGGQVIRLEIKADAAGRPYPGLVARCAAILDRHGGRGRHVLMSFEAETVREAASLGGFGSLVWLAGARRIAAMTPTEAAARCHEAGATELGVPEARASIPLRDTLRAAGLGLSVWGANHAPTIRRALDLGVDVLATDDPPLAVRLRNAPG